MLRVGVTAVGIVFGLFVLSMVLGGATAAQQEEVTLTVNVTDSNGEPIGDVTIVATEDDGETAEATTAPNGRAFVAVSEGADVDIEVDHDEYVRNIQPVSVSDASDQEVDIQMSLAGTTELTILDSENGDPVEDAQIRLTHAEESRSIERVSTDADGTARIEDIEQREYELQLSRAQYLDRTVSLSLESSFQRTTFEIERGFTRVDFNVTDGHFENEPPLESARIELETGDVLTTRSDGKQDTRLPVNDEYDVTVTKDRYEEVTETLELGEERQTFGVSIERTPLITIEPLNDAVVVGESTQVTVENAYEEPVQGARITRNGESVGQTDAVGTLRLSINDTGDNDLAASYRGLSDSVSVEGVQRAQNDQNETEMPEETDTEQSDNESEEDADSLGPGFGIVAAVVAVVGSGLLLARRRL